MSVDMSSESSSSSALRKRFLGELENSTVVLDSVDTAAVAEAWASSAIAEWLALDGAVGALAANVDTHSDAQKVVRWLEGGDIPGGDGWLGDVGTHAPVEAWELADPQAPEERGVIVSFEAQSGDRHDVSVTVADGQLLAVVVGPEGLAAATAEDDAGDGLVAQPLSVADAASIIRQATSSIAPDLSVISEASLPLLFRRFGIPLGLPQPESGEAVELPERDRELDQYGADVIRSALRAELAADMPESVNDALVECRERFERSDPDALTLAEVADWSATGELSASDLVLLAGGYLAPVTLAPHSGAEQQSLVELEVADWIGVVLGLVRAPVGTEVDGSMLVRAINTAPEITTSIPKKHAAALAWTFETMLYAWEVTGVLRDGAVGPAAPWILPHAALQAWGADSS